MPKVSQDDLKAFGLAVKRARSLKGWTLDELGAAIVPPVGKSLISKIENGTKESLNSRTVGRVINALALDEGWIDKFLDVDSSEDGDETKVEQDADRMLQIIAKDEDAPQLSEELLIQLANTYAGGKHRELQTAYVGLRNALEAAKRIKDRGDLPPDNTGSQLNVVLAEVAKLNAAGQLDEADALFDLEERRMRELHKSEKDRMDQQATALLDRRLDQDRLRNDPASAADRLVRDLMRQAPAGGVFEATRNLMLAWRSRGDGQGDPFVLRVALALGNRNMKRAKGTQKHSAMSDLGRCHLTIGQRRTDVLLLVSAEKLFRTVLKTTSKVREPENWAIAQTSVGITLAALGERQNDPSLLRAAMAAHKAALSVRNKVKSPDNWASSQLGIGDALSSLGQHEQDTKIIQDAILAFEAALTVRTKKDATEGWANTKVGIAIAKRALARLTKDTALFDEAKVLYEDALTVRKPDDALHDWANIIGGLGGLALDRFAFDKNPLHLDEAEQRLLEAKEIMSKSNDFLDERCDELLAQIAAARDGTLPDVSDSLKT